MKNYNNWGVDMGGLSMTDPERYRKINAVLTDKGMKEDTLDIVETVPLEYAYDLADDAPDAEDTAYVTELKKVVTEILLMLTPREERVIRRRFGIGVNDATLENIGQDFSLTRDRIRQIEAKALRKMKHPSVSMKMSSFLNYLNQLLTISSEDGIVSYTEKTKEMKMEILFWVMLSLALLQVGLLCWFLNETRLFKKILKTWIQRAKVIHMDNIKVGDIIVNDGISYDVEIDEEGFLWGVSNNGEDEIQIDEDFIPDCLISYSMFENVIH